METLLVSIGQSFFLILGNSTEKKDDYRERMLILKKIYRGLFLAFLLLLSGCGQETKTEKTETQKTEHDETKESAEAFSEIPTAPSKKEDLPKQKPGQLVEEYLKDAELVEEDGYQAKLAGDFTKELQSNLTQYIKKTEQDNPQEMYDFIISQVGSGKYLTLIEEGSNFEPNFKEPNLPSGPNGESANSNEEPREQNAVILIDASGSMKAKVPGGVKMELAKDAVNQFASQLGEKAKTALIVYGHIGTGSDADKAKSCSEIETMYTLGDYKKGDFQQALQSFEASGWTPLASGIDKAKEMLQNYSGENYQNTVYIVSDGIETCDGDPVAAAKSLSDSNIKAEVNIIGFDVDDKGQKQLKAVSEAGEGTYTTVKTKDELYNTMEKEWRPSLGTLAWIHMEAPIGWDFVREYDRYDAEIGDKFKTAVKRESDRVSTAIRYLRQEELVKNEILNELENIKSDAYSMKMDATSEQRQKVIDHIKMRGDEIKQEVEEWKAKYE
jgi:Ca-activated chloride channel homolog